MLPDGRMCISILLYASGVVVSNKHLLVTFFVLGMAVWLFSGELSNNTVEAQEARENAGTTTALVRGVSSVAESRTLFLDVRAQTRANRVVDVKAEISGKIVAMPGEKGRFVKAGDPLCRIAVESRQNEYDEALAEVHSAQLEFDGFKDLNKKGLQSAVMMAKAEAALAQSETRANRAKLALDKTSVVAPFNGVVDRQPVEVGDYLTPGAVCAGLIEIDPMLVVGQVAEKNIAAVSLNDDVSIELITGNVYRGKVSFIGHSPDMTTRTFPIEVTISNPGAEVRAGITATMRVPVGQETVHLISPASLVLNDAGAIGVRIVDEESKARFIKVEIVDESPEGVLIKGLPDEVNLITVGQEEVTEGQLVRMDYTPLAALVSF